MYIVQYKPLVGHKTTTNEDINYFLQNSKNTFLYANVVDAHRHIYQHNIRQLISILKLKLSESDFETFCNLHSLKDLNKMEFEELCDKNEKVKLQLIDNIEYLPYNMIAIAFVKEHNGFF